MEPSWALGFGVYDIVSRVLGGFYVLWGLGKKQAFLLTRKSATWCRNF